MPRKYQPRPPTVKDCACGCATPVVGRSDKRWATPYCRIKDLRRRQKAQQPGAVPAPVSLPTAAR